MHTKDFFSFVVHAVGYGENVEEERRSVHKSSKVEQSIMMTAKAEPALMDAEH